MKTPSIVLQAVLLLVALAACRSHQGLNLGFAMQPLGLLTPASMVRKAPSPLEKYVTLLEEERQREVRWRAVQRKLAEYEQWGRELLATYVPPPRRLAPGYLLSESPLRERPCGRWAVPRWPGPMGTRRTRTS